MMRTDNIQTIINGIFEGNKRMIARAISYIENNHAASSEILEAIYPACGKAHVIGITGPPGAGKSTLVGAYVAHLRQQQIKCGLILVDPSSPFTGGAILGDRIRMPALTGDDGVYIRSMGTRGSLGGLAKATRDAIKILDAAGCEKIIIETVGIGQAETDIIKTSDTVVVVSVPGLGDHIQTLKAGVMEIADIFVVNKADKDGASRTIKELKMMIELSNYAPEDRPEVIPVIAIQNEGINELGDNIDKLYKKTIENGKLESRRKQQIEIELKDIIYYQLIKQINDRISDSEFNKNVDMIYNHEVTPHQTANKILKSLVNKGDD